MNRSYLLNLTRIRAIAQALIPLEQKVVFVGGATVCLYTNPEVASEVRPTDDVDVVVELATYGNYAALEERLRTIGFINDKEAKIICRYKIQGITVDIMPTDSAIIGFSNRWYLEGFQNSIQYPLSENQSIHIFLLEYLIASKLEAFFSRGANNFLFSHDFEDIIYLLENAESVEGALLYYRGALRNYLKTSFASLLAHSDFEEGLYTHLDPEHASYQAARMIQILKLIIER